MILNKKINRLWLLGFIIIALYIVGCAAAPSETPSPSTEAPRLPGKVQTLPAPAPPSEGARLPSEPGELHDIGRGISGVILGTPGPGAELSIGPPSFHLWDALRQEGDEKHGYGMYTYVLFGWKIDNPANDPETAERYKKLLDAITSKTPNLSTGKDLNKKEVNLFCIPSKKDYKDGKFNLEHYNFNIAQRIILRFAAMIKDHKRMFERITTRSGPFLITIAHPLDSYTEGHFPLLYADLSESNPAAILETVMTYKKYIISKKIDTEEEFHPIKLILLNFILDTNRNLLIVSAHAKELIR